MIRIKLNGENQQLGEKKTLAELLERLSLSTPHFAVAVNRSVVPRSEHEKRILQDGDEVEVVHPMGGG